MIHTYSFNLTALQLLFGFFVAKNLWTLVQGFSTNEGIKKEYPHLRKWISANKQQCKSNTGWQLLQDSKERGIGGICEMGSDEIIFSGMHSYVLELRITANRILLSATEIIQYSIKICNAHNVCQLAECRIRGAMNEAQNVKLVRVCLISALIFAYQS